MSLQLTRLGLLSEIDRGAFLAYCEAYGRWCSAQRAIRKLASTDPDSQEGLVLRTSNGNVIQNPAVGIGNKAARDMVQFAAEFGMTPSARARLGMSKSPDKAKSKFGGTLWGEDG
jgi:P27 family predicted phage terminase small subunit